jgi:hypothetical protein
MALPTVQVLLDDGTGTFPYDITSKVMLIDGFSFTRGREDWQGGVTAGTFSLTLNNSDGRFSPGSTTIASPSPIKVDAQIRLKETINAVTYTRFTGYVKSWPVAWPATVSTFSTVQVTASDAQARAERRVLRSVVEEEILEDTPVAYYTLSEPVGATSAGDTSGNQAPTLTQIGSGTAVVWGSGTGPGTDSLTAATFAGGQYLTAALAATPGAIEFWFSTTTNDATIRPIISTGGTTPLLAILSGQLYDPSTHNNFGAVADGLVHHAFLVGSTVYLDSVSAGTGTPPPAGNLSLQVGGIPAQTGFATFVGSVSHVAVYSGSPSATRVTAHYTAGTTGFAGESDTARLTRLAGYANITVGTLDTPLTNVAFIPIETRSAWDCIQEVADAGVGVTYIDGTGSLVFHNRNRVPAKTTPDLTLAATYVVPDAQPTQDDQRILNYIEATAVGTSAAQVVNSSTSETSHGRYSDSKSYLVSTDAEALDRANWIIGNFAEPSTRFGTLTINLYKMDAATASSVIAAIDIDCWLQITGMPSQTPGGTTVDLVVESIAEQVTGSSWTLTCNVVAQSLFDVWILGDATAGVLGTTTRLYV